VLNFIIILGAHVGSQKKAAPKATTQKDTTISKDKEEPMRK